MENDTTNNKEQLLTEITKLKKRILELENSDIPSKPKNTPETDDEIFRLIAKNTSDGISLHSFNLKATYTYVSPAMEMLSGYKAEYLIGKSPFDFVHPDDKKILIKILKDYVNKKIKKLFNNTEDKVSENLEFRYKHSSGKWIYFQSTGNISGKQLLFVTRDITKQKQIQQNLFQSENKYKSLFEQSADALLIIEGDKFVDCNAATVDMLKYRNKKELLELHPAMLSPELQPDGTPSNKKADEMMSIAYKKGSHRFEWNHKKANGEVFPVEVLLTAVPVGSEKFLHVVWRDITERKKSENDLMQSEERFRRLFEDLGDAVFVTKVGGYNKGHILEVNSAAIKQTGYSRDELLNMNIIRDFLIVDSGEINSDDWEEKLLSGEVVRTVEKKKRKDGSEYWTEVVVTLIDYKGEKAGLSINHDITKQKIAEDALRSIAAQFSALSGLEFLEKVCLHLSESLKIDFAFVGVLLPEQDKVRVKAGIGKGKPIQQFEYDLADTPCENVMGQSVCSYPSDVQSLFPKDFLLVEMGIDSYIGIPLFNRKGAPMGIIVLLHSKPLDNVETATSLLQIFSERVAAEMERLDTEEELRIREEKFRLLYKNTPVMLHSIDRDGRIISVSNHWLDKMGYTEEEVIGIRSTEFLTEASRTKAINEILPGFFKAGYINDTPYDFVKKNGEIINVLLSAISEKDESGTVIRSMAVLVDVSESKKSQLALAESDTFLRKSQKVAALGTYVLDISTGIWKCSSILDNIFGIEEDTKKNIDLWVQIVHSDDRDMMQNYFATNVITNHEPFNKEYRINRINDGQERWVHGLGELEFNDDGDPITMIGTIQDITDRKLVEDSLAEQSQRLDYTLQGTNAGSWDWNIQTGELVINDRWAEIMGYTLSELEPIDVNTWANNVHPEDLKKANALLEDHFGGKTDYYDTEFRQPHKDGSWVWVNARGKVTEWSADEKPLRMSGTHIDISSRKKAQEDLIIALEKATESDRLKSAFLATMSHELRTPLNAIIGFSNLIDKDMPFDDVISFTKTINSSGNHLLSIVEDLFDITLIESGEIKIQKKEEELHSILNDVKKLMDVEQKVINKQHLDQRLMIPPDSKELIINTDSAKLKQILINLIKNALKFTPDGYVHYGYNIEEEEDQKVIKFYVEDTGIGISEDKQKFIFDVFRQVEDSHTRVHGGTGIGLSIARKLCELLGGRIWLESEIRTQDKRGGTKFYFTIPFENIKPTGKTDKKEIIKEIKKPDTIAEEKTILIVEDDKDSYEFLKIVLQMAKINTIWAEDGKSAIRYCKENSDIDLVLMDINMPVMNGYEATKEIKKFKPNIPIIAQTAYAIAGDKEKAIAEGCDDYISKPIIKDVLMDKIDSLLGH